jgi:hypothetical protein
MKVAAIPTGLVHQHPAYLCKRRIRDASSQASIVQHSSNIQLFYDHCSMATSKTSGQLVQGVATKVGDAGMYSSDPAATLLSALASHLAAAELSLRPSKGMKVSPERSWVLLETDDEPWAGRHCQVPYSNVDSDYRVFSVRGGNRASHFHRERNKPALRSPRDGGGPYSGGTSLNTAGKLSR